MNKIRILFFVLLLIVSIIYVMMFTGLPVPGTPEIEKISEFQVTRISGNGAIYADKKPIKDENLSRPNILDIKEMYYKEEMYIKADPQTSFEFFYAGTSFIVLPGSHIFYQPKTNRLRLYKGEYFWNKEIKKEMPPIALASENETGVKNAEMILSIPDSGRLKITPDLIEIWNYSGNMKLNYKNQEYGAINHQIIQVKNQTAQVFDIFPPPQFISPEDKKIPLTTAADFYVKFNWKAVAGAKDYILRLYSSNLKDNLLDEITLSEPEKTINLEVYGVNEFFWQVFPCDMSNKREGAPSLIGNIKLIGSIGDEAKALEHPKLVITSFNTSGNMVLIKGEADKTCQLFINDENVAINMDGTFYYTKSFNQIGSKTIVLRLVAPTGMETRITKTSTIFEE